VRKEFNSQWPQKRRFICAFWLGIAIQVWATGKAETHVSPLRIGSLGISGLETVFNFPPTPGVLR
jgi:hypothetical protein